MKKLLCLLAIVVLIGSSAGWGQEEKAEEKAKEDKSEEEVVVLEELKDPNNDRRSIGWEVSTRPSEASLERKRQKEREEAYSEAKKERLEKVRRLRGGD